jgi:hypothetical protein
VAFKALPSLPRTPRIRLDDPWNLVDRVILFRREPGETTFVPTEVAVTNHLAQLDLTSASGRPAWYLEARDSAGALLAREGSPELPHFVPEAHPAPIARRETVPPPPGNPRRVAAVVVGVVAVGAGLAGAYAQVSAAASARAAEEARWVDDGRALHQRATTEATWATGLFAAAGAAGVASTVLFVW